MSDDTVKAQEREKGAALLTNTLVEFALFLHEGGMLRHPATEAHPLDLVAAFIALRAADNASNGGGDDGE